MPPVDGPRITQNVHAREHPRSGWTALYIGRWACEIEGLPEAEGRDLVRYLQEWTIRPEFVYRHRWRVGDAILWDNRCTQHCATEFDEARHRRRMHRTTLEGDVPRLARSPRLRPPPGPMVRPPPFWRLPGPKPPPPGPNP